MLLTNYYQKFKMRSGKKSLPSLQEFLLLFDVAFLDCMRWLCGYGLWGGPAEEWSLLKADEILNKLECGKGILSEAGYRDALVS